MGYPIWYPPATVREVPSNSSGMVVPAMGFIPHVQVGNSSLFGYFKNTANQASSHLWLSKSGVWEQYVRFDRKAWAQGSGNPYWISCECEGFDTEPYTQIQVNKLAEFYVFGYFQFGWPLRITDRTDVAGIGTHRMGGKAWGGHSCPGEIRANQRALILGGAKSLLEMRYNSRPVIQNGARGSDVRDLQDALHLALDFKKVRTTGLIPDGVFGPNTEAAVRAFQGTSYNLLGANVIGTDGVVGPITWKKLAVVLTFMGK